MRSGEMLNDCRELSAIPTLKAGGDFQPDHFGKAVAIEIAMPEYARLVLSIARRPPANKVSPTRRRG